MVVTGDRDAYQLVDDGVRIMTTSRGITDTRVYDREGVVERYGIPPELVPDFIGLKGDTSDNIPGVPGIGDKTAAQLLQQFGSLEEVLANVDEITGAKRKQNLTEHADDARLQAARDHQARHRRRHRRRGGGVPRARPLAPARGVPPVRAARPAAPPGGGAGLGRGGGAAAARAPAQAVRRRCARRPLADVARLRGRGARAGRARARGARGRAVRRGHAVALRRPRRRRQRARGRRRAGPRPWSPRPATAPLWCTTPRRWAPCPPTSRTTRWSPPTCSIPPARAYPLDELSADRGLGADVEDEAARDALLVGALAAWQREQLHERGHEPLLRDIELPLVRVLRDMEQAGIKLDTEALAAISTRVKEDAAALEREIFELAGEEFTIGSPQQLAEILFDKLGLSRKRRGKTGFSTDARVLQAIRDEHAIIPKIERFRELTKLAQTYLDALPALIADDGRLHTTFSQVTAATGRLSSINPNLQNIPIRTELGREIRACFVAEPGNVLLSADYSQVELRVLAQVADEPVLKEIFRAARTCTRRRPMQVFGVAEDEIDPGMRSKAKMINYGIVYGLSGLRAGRPPADPAGGGDAFIDAYLERFPAVKAFIERTIEQATEDGYVTTLFGRRRRVPELRAAPLGDAQLGERLAVNTVIQGTAADIIKVAMVRCARRARRRRPADAPDPPDPRRAAVRGARGGGRARARAGVRGDDRGVRARPAAGGRRRERAQLDGGEVGVDRGLAVVLTACTGGLVALQAPINSMLGKTVGDLAGGGGLLRHRHGAPGGHRGRRLRRLRLDRRGAPRELVLPHRRPPRRARTSRPCWSRCARWARAASPPRRSPAS